MKTKILTVLLSYGLTVFFLLTFCMAYGQNNRLIYSKQVSNATEKTNEILQKGSAYVSVDFVEINLEAVFSIKIIHK